MPETLDGTEKPNYGTLAYLVRPFSRDDIRFVSRVEREAFATTWPPTDFNGELSNPLAYYLVVARASHQEDHLDTSGTSGDTHSHFNKSSNRRGILDVVREFLDRVRSTSITEEIPGYIGLWLMGEEAHIVSIAVTESYQGRGLGELLLIGGIELALLRNADVVTLEVRVSNHKAQKLYAKYGFQVRGIRKGYYRDNNEDAYIMTTDPILLEPYRTKFTKLVATHEDYWGVSQRLL